MRGTTRSYDNAVHDLLAQRLTELAELQAQACHCAAEVIHEPRTTVLVTHEAQTRLSIAAASALAGEDFAFMLQERLGVYVRRQRHCWRGWDPACPAHAGL